MLRCACYVIVVLLFSPAAGSQQPLGSVHGQVVLADTGAPAEGTIVSLLPAAPSPILPATGEYVVRNQIHRGDLHATAAPDGSFAIDDVPAGEYAILTYKPGYVSQDPHLTAGSDSGVQTVHVSEGQPTRVNLTLQRGGSIEGHVQFEDRSALPNGRSVIDTVAVNVEREIAPGRFVRFGGAAHTDVAGHYSIGGLPPGRYIVFAAFPPKMVRTATGLVSGSGRIVFAAGTFRPSRARVIAVSREETRAGVDIEVARMGLHRITGRLVDASGRPVTVGLVRVFPSGEPQLSLSTPPDTNGEFVFADLPDDIYTVSFEAEGKVEFRGLTPDGTGVRMFRDKPAFAPAKRDVTVEGQDPPPILLKLQPTS